jgi:ubiquinone/menaquinone biosynthesis C-methylase UbiE
MGLYGRYVLPRLIETACSQKPLMELRSRYVPGARGRVLEIGIGSGHNLRFYGNEVTSVTGIDPAPELTVRARERARTLHCEVYVIEQSGETIPTEDAFFDTVVCTWTLCSIPNVYRALDEMRRVLTPDGRLIFIEHGRAPDPRVARWQERIEPLWKKIGGGCHLSRPVSQLIEDAGFQITELQTGHVPGPKVASFMYHGIAVRR